MLDVLNLTPLDTHFDGGASATVIINEIVKMVHLKDFVDGKRRYLILVDCEDDLPKSGTCLAAGPSLLHPGSRAKSLVNSQNFRKNMSIVVKLNNMDAYVLQNMMPDKDATNYKPPKSGTFYYVRCNKMEIQHGEDSDILRVFCESWCPTTNMLHNIADKLSMSLWDLYKLGGLPIFDQIYDEAVPDIHTLRAHTDKGNRRIPKACESLLTAD
ncbi:Alanine--tRNA ligase [Bienertia sinuspersici]